MNPQEIRQAISAIAAQLKGSPDLMRGQIELLRQSLPNASEETLRQLVDKLSAPNFNAASCEAELKALLRK